jgi:hypothetical protein
VKNLIILIAALLLTSCQNSSKIPEDVKWKIIKEEPNIAYKKDNIVIQLNKKISEEILKEIALEIREDRQQYDRLWVFYQIEGMGDETAWAITHFTPGLEIEILGSIDAQDEETANTSDISGEILGKWRCDKSLSGATLVLYKDTNNKIIMRLKLKTGSIIDEGVTESKTKGKTSYITGNKHGEYYILESNGNLGMYDYEGKFDEAKKLD